MESSISVGLASQVALRRRLDLVAHNLANAGTTGFKLEAQIVQVMPRTDGADPIVYPIDRGTYTDFRGGPIEVTGNPLDVAINGEGFFAVQTPGGPRYTRDGRLSRSADGTLISETGYPVLDVAGGALVIPPETGSVAITTDGTVVADAEEVGRLGVFRLAIEQGQRRGADGLFTAEGAVTALPVVNLQQRALERSNVQPVAEIVELMDLHRSYERVQTLLDREDERIRRLIERALSI